MSIHILDILVRSAVSLLQVNVTFMIHHTNSGQLGTKHNHHRVTQLCAKMNKHQKPKTWTNYKSVGLRAQDYTLSHKNVPLFYNNFDKHNLNFISFYSCRSSCTKTDHLTANLLTCYLMKSKCLTEHL